MGDFDLPQRADAHEAKARADELAARRQDYRYVHDPALPPTVVALPLQQKFSTGKNVGLFTDITKAVIGLGIGKLEQLVMEARIGRDKLALYDCFYPKKAIPPVYYRFRRDDEFGRQRLAGLNPKLLRRCEAIPDHFAVTDALARPSMDPGQTLRSAMNEARLYLLDHAVMETIPIVEGRFSTAPMCLLYVDDDSQLRPIAIQLHQSPDAGPVYTPQSEEWLWLAAKMWVQCADAGYHEVLAHLLPTHLCMEPIAIAAERQLSAQHPLLELLRHHFHDTLAINWSARNSMLAPGGAIDQSMAVGAAGAVELAKVGYRDWTFTGANLRTDLAARGVDNGDDLPGYHYRTDALLLYDAIAAFISELLSVFYRSDEDVRVDTELQAFAAELLDPEGAAVNGLPSGGVAQDRASLAAFVAQVVYTCSAEHASVNNGQYDMFGYIPNVPGMMVSAPPTPDVTRMSEAEIVACLPDYKTSATQIAMVDLLSTPTERPLGYYPTDFMGGNAEVAAVVRRFQDGLDLVSDRIQSRNIRLDVPYRYLDPRQIAQSIEI